MTAHDTTSRRLSTGAVDFALMYAAHDAFERDLRRLAAAAATGRAADSAVHAGWQTFKRQLHIHHTAEDAWLWPALRAKATRPADVAVLDQMEAEHARIDPLLNEADASITAGDNAGLAANAETLAAALTGHMQHEEDRALPLVETLLGPQGWAAFGRQVGKSQGLKGGAEFFPWMLDDALAGTRKRVLGMLPPPARLLYRTLWAPRYRRTPHWDGAR